MFRNRCPFIFILILPFIGLSQITTDNNAPYDEEDYLVNDVFLGGDIVTSNFSSVGFNISFKLVTDILMDSLNIISLAFISWRIRFGKAFRSNVWFLTRSSSLRSIMRFKCSSSFSWCTYKY